MLSSLSHSEGNPNQIETVEEIEEEPKQNDSPSSQGRALTGFLEPTSQAPHVHNEVTGAALKLHSFVFSEAWL